MENMSLESLLNELVAAKTEVERLKAEMNSSVCQEHLEYVAEQAEVSQMEIGQMNDVLQGDYLVKRIRDGIEVALELGATSDQLKHWSESQPSKSVLKELSDFITATKQA